MTPDELIKWHEKCADNASSRGAHTIASKHAKTVHFMRAALEPIAPPDVAQAARVLIPVLVAKHDAYMRAKNRNPIDYTSKYISAANVLSAIADGGAE